MELSPTGTEWNVRGFAYSNPDRNVYLWSCTGGDSIPLMFSLSNFYQSLCRYHVVMCVSLFGGIPLPGCLCPTAWLVHVISFMSATYTPMFPSHALLTSCHLQPHSSLMLCYTRLLESHALQFLVLAFTYAYMHIDDASIHMTCDKHICR